MDPTYANKLLALNTQIPAPWAPGRPRMRLLKTSEQRAKICAMNHDPITAGLWALAGFDPALVHLAELRERFANLSEDDQIRTTLDRLTSVYVEGQCRELEHGIGITTEALTIIGTNSHDFINRAIELDPDTDVVTRYILDCTSDPLSLEVCGYAMRLGTLTAHGMAPWKRFAAVMADCHAQLVS